MNANDLLRVAKFSGACKESITWLSDLAPSMDGRDVIRALPQSRAIWATYLPHYDKAFHALSEPLSTNYNRMRRVLLEKTWQKDDMYFKAADAVWEAYKLAMLSLYDEFEALVFRIAEPRMYLWLNSFTNTECQIQPIYDECQNVTKMLINSANNHWTVTKPAPDKFLVVSQRDTFEYSGIAPIGCIRRYILRIYER